MSKHLSQKELEYYVNHLSDLDSDNVDESDGDAFDDDEDDNFCPDNPDLSESDQEEVASEVSDIQSASDMDDLPQQDSDVMLAKDGTQWFCNAPPESRTRAHNIITGQFKKVVLPPGKILEDPLDAFLLYLDSDIMDDIVKFTNLEANRILQNKKNKWKNCAQIEMYAFIGLLLTASHLKQHHTNYEVLWNSIYGPPIFRATMGLQRFKALLRFIRFDDKATRSKRRKKDKFVPFRVWEKINHKLSKYYIPGANLTIDEQLVPFRDRVPFRQYLPSKPDKYGMKIFWLCDSETFYALKGLPYLGTGVKLAIDFSHRN